MEVRDDLVRIVRVEKRRKMLSSVFLGLIALLFVLPMLSNPTTTSIICGMLGLGATLYALGFVLDSKVYGYPQLCKKFDRPAIIHKKRVGFALLCIEWFPGSAVFVKATNGETYATDFGKSLEQLIKRYPEISDILKRMWREIQNFVEKNARKVVAELI